MTGVALAGAGVVGVTDGSGLGMGGVGQFGLDSSQVGDQVIFTSEELLGPRGGRMERQAAPQGARQKAPQAGMSGRGCRVQTGAVGADGFEVGAYSLLVQPQSDEAVALDWELVVKSLLCHL
jgi:hypothetical protein